MQPRINRTTPSRQAPLAVLADADRNPPDWSTQAFAVTLNLRHPQFTARCRQLYPRLDLNRVYENSCLVSRPAAAVKSNGLSIIETHLLYTVPWPGSWRDWNHRLLPLHCHQQYVQRMNRLQDQRIAKTVELSEAVYRLTNSPEPGKPQSQETMLHAFREETFFSWRIDPAPAWDEYLADHAARFPWSLLICLKMVCPVRRLAEIQEAYRQTARRLPRHDPMEGRLGFYTIRDQFNNRKDYYKILRKGLRPDIFSKTKGYPRRIKNPRGI